MQIEPKMFVRSLLALASIAVVFPLVGCNVTTDLGVYQGPALEADAGVNEPDVFHVIRPDATAVDATTADATAADASDEQLADAATRQDIFLDLVEPDDPEMCSDVFLSFDVEDLDTDWRSQDYDGETLATPCKNDNCNQMEGQAVLEFEVACAGLYRVWVMGLDEGFADSFYVQLDDTPAEPVIFELGCEEDGDGLTWTSLNSRTDEGNACTALPWDPELAAGVHRLHMWPRESRGIARVVVTNSFSWIPPMD